MNEVKLLELGFIDTSFTEDNSEFTQHTLIANKFSIEISGLNFVEIKLLDNGWVDVPNCKTIEGLKQLIKLFK